MSDSRQYFAINHITRKAVIINASDFHDARMTANTIIGPETAAHQIGVCPRPRAAFDRFPDMPANIVFDVPGVR